MKSSNLMYHDVVLTDEPSESGFTMAGASRYKFHIDKFNEHLLLISQSGISPARPVHETILDHRPGGNFMITFDDGGISALNLITPVLNRLGWTGHFFISTDFIGKKGFLNQDHIVELRGMGHVVGSHSCSHPLIISKLSRNEIEYEWMKSREILSGILQSDDIDTASVPGGFLSPIVAEMAQRSGYKFLFTSEPEQRIRKSDGLYIIGRYTMFNYLNAAAAAALAKGNFTACSREYLYWNLKKFAKKFAGGLYRKIRERSIG